jgi:hypothetical protein
MNDQPLRPRPKTGEGSVDLLLDAGEHEFDLHTDR